MHCKILSVVFVVLGLMLTGQAYAGGPPWLVLPIDGITSENVAGCRELLNKALSDKIWAEDNKQAGVQMREHDGQWYSVIELKEDVSLQDVEAALDDSPYHVNRDKLHFFGHVVLEVNVPGQSSKDVLGKLAEREYVTVAETKKTKDQIQITLDLPYPETDESLARHSIGWTTFARNDLSSDQSARSESPATAAQLPTYNELATLLAQHNAELKNVCWSIEYACRPLGAVSAAPSETVAAAKSAKAN